MVGCYDRLDGKETLVTLACNAVAEGEEDTYATFETTISPLADGMARPRSTCPADTDLGILGQCDWSGEIASSGWE
jgi:hypothetical protein